MTEAGSDVMQMRLEMIKIGMDPESVNDVIMEIGGKSFVHLGNSLLDRFERVEKLIEGDTEKLFRPLYERELLLQLMGIDPNDPLAGVKATTKLGHLASHADKDDCALGVSILENFNLFRG